MGSLIPVATHEHFASMVVDDAEDNPTDPEQQIKTQRYKSPLNNMSEV